MMMSASTVWPRYGGKGHYCKCIVLSGPSRCWGLVQQAWDTIPSTLRDRNSRKQTYEFKWSCLQRSTLPNIELGPELISYIWWEMHLMTCFNMYLGASGENKCCIWMRGKKDMKREKQMHCQEVKTGRMNGGFCRYQRLWRDIRCDHGQMSRWLLLGVSGNASICYVEEMRKYIL